MLAVANMLTEEGRVGKFIYSRVPAPKNHSPSIFAMMIKLAFTAAADNEARPLGASNIEELSACVVSRNAEVWVLAVSHG